MGPESLGILWGDGHQTTYNVRQLRLLCPCASCVNEMTGVKILKEENVPLSVKPIKIEGVGHYAFGIHWSDGHNTGLYTLEYLRNHDSQE